MVRAGAGKKLASDLEAVLCIGGNVAVTREGANRLALVTLEQMTQTLAWAVENPAQRLQIFEPPQIKQGGQVAANRQAVATSV